MFAFIILFYNRKVCTLHQVILIKLDVADRTTTNNYCYRNSIHILAHFGPSLSRHAVTSVTPPPLPLPFTEWQLPLLSHSKTVRIHGSIPPSLKSTVGGSCCLCSFASKGLEVLSLFSYVMAIQPVDPQNGLYSSFKNTAHISHKQQYQNIYNEDSSTCTHVHM